MSRRALKRLAAVVSAPILAIGLVLVAWNGAASAHDVTGITANCDEVVVSFANFPDAGVMVHISAQVGAQAAVTKDVFVTSSTVNATVDIGAETALLFGASADVTVDVTWDFDGAQHVHQVLSVTCGTETTTTHPTTTTTGVGATTSTTAATTTTTHPTTTTTGVGATTSTTAATTTTTAPGGGTTSTTAAPGGGTTTPPTTSGSVVTVGATTETANTAVLGESVTAAPASATSTGSSSGGTLPHTGDDTGALGLAALVLLSAGTTILGVVRKRRLS